MGCYNDDFCRRKRHYYRDDFRNRCDDCSPRGFYPHPRRRRPFGGPEYDVFFGHPRFFK